MLSRYLLSAAIAMAGCTVDLSASESDFAELKAEIAKNHPQALARLQDWVRKPAIAAEDRGFPEGPEHMAALLREVGFQHVEILPTKGKPGVFATLDAGAEKTVGLYFMYDVKQFDAAEWKAAPPLSADLVDRPGLGQVLIGRGAVNQKGPQAAFLAALDAFRTAGKKLPVNLVLVAEGEEEIGSPNIADFVLRPHVREALSRCTGVWMPHATQGLDGAVQVNLGAKGVIEVELTASGTSWGRGPMRDVHSSFKSMVDSPVWRLVTALNTLVTPDGNTPAIDGWFDNVRPLTDRERELIQQGARNSSEADWKQRNGVSHFIDDLPWAQALERLASQPTVNIEGLVAGYTGPGGMTILPGRGVAKLDFRLVPNQTRAQAEAKLRAHLDARGFSDVQVVVSGGYDPTETAEDSAIVQAQLAVYRRAGARATLNPRLAGSWPGAVFTAAPVSLPAGQFGLGHGSGAHAPNEYLLIDSNNSRVQGLTGAVMGFIDIMYELAR